MPLRQALRRLYRPGSRGTVRARDRPARLGPLLLAAGAAFTAGAADTADEAWEFSISRSLGGRLLPAQTLLQCLPAGATYAPAPPDPGCQVVARIVSGHTTRTTLSCPGASPTTISLAIARRGRWMHGTVTTTTAGQSVRDAVVGRQTGTCTTPSR